MKSSTWLLLFAAFSVVMFHVADDPMEQAVHGISVPIYIAAVLIASILEGEDKT